MVSGMPSEATILAMAAELPSAPVNLPDARIDGLRAAVDLRIEALIELSATMSCLLAVRHAD